MKKFATAIALLLVNALTVLTAFAQIVEPVHLKGRMDMKADGLAEIVFEGPIDKGWHVYSTRLGNDGPISATLIVNQMNGAELVGSLEPRGKEVEKFDNMFGMKLRFFEGFASFVQKVKITGADYSIDCALEYGACDDESCLPPTRIAFSKAGQTTPAVEAAVPAAVPVPEKKAVAELPDSWTPVIDSMQQHGTQTAITNMPLWQILLEGFIGGLLAIFTPCVWPIIPLTVSFFLKRSANRRKAIADALTYGLSIVVIYMALGLLVSFFVGADALNNMSTNAVFNILFFLLLVVFAASFFGAFEITLPSSWTDRMEEHKSNASGVLAIFFMAFMLALVSFSCTGPIVGVLLVAVSTQSSWLAPTVGMLGFALALALPFTLFALFPSMLKSAPRSGSWMNAIKVTLGFLELAFALKFLSVADMAYGWRLLDREVFLSLWIVIFGLLGAYHMGWLKFSHDAPDARTNVPQFFIGLLSLAFTVYLVPGLWGAPLKAVSAFAPPMTTQDFNLAKSEVEVKYHDYEQALQASEATGKPVLVDFTGFGCVNCRKMEAAVWADPRVAQIINEQFILVSLYVDDKTPLPEPVMVSENGQEKELRTVADKWSFLQRHKFGANIQPFYVVLDAQGNPLTGSRSYDEDVTAYVEFLLSGLK